MPSKQPFRDYLTRRELILGSAAGALLLTLGCGGNCGGTDSGASGPGGLVRPTPTGTLREQVEAYSQAIDKYSLTADRRHPTTDGIAALILGGSRGLDDNPLHATVGSVLIGLFLQRQMANLASSALVDLDSAAWLADQTSQNSGLTGNGALSNPQWTLATFHQIHCTLAMAHGHLRWLKCAFVEDYAEATLESSDRTTRLIQAGLFCDIFNSFVTETSSRAGMTSPASTWLITVTETMSDDAVANEVRRWKEIIPSLPFTGYLPGTRQVGSETELVSLADSFVAAVIDEVKYEIVDRREIAQIAPQMELKPERQRLRERFVQGVGVWPRISQKALLGATQAEVEAKAMEAAVEYASRSESRITKVLAGTSVVSQAVISGLKMTASGLQAAAMSRVPWAREVTAVQFGLDVAAHKETSALAGEQLARIVYGPSAHPDLTIYSESVETLEWSSTFVSDAGLREIPAPLQNVADAECDVIASAGLSNRSMTIPRAENAQLDQLFNSDPAAARAALDQSASRQPGLTIQDTFRNREAASAALLLDYADRHLSFSALRKEGRMAEFFRSDVAAFVRREPEDRSAPFPAITSAQMMCTSPGFIPMRAAEKDLSTLAALPALRPISELGEGIDVEVS